MPQSLSKVALHVTFSTKDRLRVLNQRELRQHLEGYMVGILRNLDCPSIATRAVCDHVHTLFLLARTVTIADVVQTVKKESSKWVKDQAAARTDPYLAKSHWQKGYGVFSVSESMVSRVRRYIERQEEHHKRMTFQEEYRALLEKHGIAYDERYVWD